MTDKTYTEDLNRFFQAILALETEEDCVAFFDDICTIKELKDITQRLKVATMLKNKCSYQEVADTTSASTATICRVSKCLHYGPGGYKKILDKIEGGEKK